MKIGDEIDSKKNAMQTVRQRVKKGDGDKQTKQRRVNKKKREGERVTTKNVSTRRRDVRMKETRQKRCQQKGRRR